MYFENTKKTSSMHLRKCALNKVLKIKLKMVVEGGTKKVLKVKKKNRRRCKKIRLVETRPEMRDNEEEYN